MSDHQAAARLLSWMTPEGKTCVLVSDGESGFSRVADRIEDVQLEMADGLLAHAADMLGGDRATEVQLRFLGRQLSAALRDVRRVAECRGGMRMRIITAAEGGQEGGGDGGDEHPGRPWTPPPPPPPDGDMPPGDGTHRK